MSDKILVLRINIWFIIRKLEEIIYNQLDYEIEAKIREINQKVYWKCCWNNRETRDVRGKKFKKC